MFLWLSYKLVLLGLGLLVGLAIAVQRTRLRRSESNLAADVAALARVAPGGRAAEPLVVPSASVVESRATALPCHACDEKQLRVEHHTTEDHDGERLRVVQVSCASCGHGRKVYLRVAAD